MISYRRDLFKLHHIGGNSYGVKTQQRHSARAVCPKKTRGIHLSKADIIRCLTPIPTGYRYLSLTDMDKSLSVELDISSLPYFDPAPLGKSVEQYCIRKDMVLMSKNDTPYKVDFVGDIGDEKIIISGNIYMMTVDAQRISSACPSG